MPPWERIMKIKESSFKALRFLAVCLLVMYLMFGHQYQVTYNYGESMIPTFSNGEWIYSQKRSHLPKEWTPSQLDIIVVTKEGEDLVKRVVALEGDVVYIKHGKIYVNDKIYKDQFSEKHITFWTEDEEIRNKKPENEWLFLNVYQDIGRVPEGHVWVIGDNRSLSWYGMVKIKNIKSLVIF